MLESAKVERAMIVFGDILGNCEKLNDKACFLPVVPGNKRTKLQIAALNLAHCARESLQEVWEPVPIENLGGDCHLPDDNHDLSIEHNSTTELEQEEATNVKKFY